jgi:hypothetical protein
MAVVLLPELKDNAAEGSRPRDSTRIYLDPDDTGGNPARFNAGGTRIIDLFLIFSDKDLFSSGRQKPFLPVQTRGYNN